MKSKHPETRVLCDCVFVPSRPSGHWDAEVAVHDVIQSDQMIDCDRDALRANQVSLSQLPGQYSSASNKIYNDNLSNYL